MERRQFIGSAVIGLSAVAGCSSNSDNQTDSSPNTDTPEATATPNQTATPEPASFTVEEFSLQESAEIGQQYDITITVTNTGETDGVYESELSARTPESDWQSLNPITIDVPADETVTVTETTNSGYDYMTTLTYRLEKADMTASINIVSRQLPFGSIYESPNGVSMTAINIDFQDTYEWSSGSYDYEEEPADGNKWAFLRFRAENTSGQPEYLPFNSDIVLLAGNSQYDSSVYQGGDITMYEGGEVQAGIVREGMILYEVPESLEKSDIQAAWSEDTYDGSIAVYWQHS